MSFTYQPWKRLTPAEVARVAPGQYGVYGVADDRAWVYIAIGDIQQGLSLVLQGEPPEVARHSPTRWMAEVTPDAEHRAKMLILELRPICNRRVPLRSTSPDPSAPPPRAPRMVDLVVGLRRRREPATGAGLEDVLRHRLSSAGQIWREFQPLSGLPEEQFEELYARIGRGLTWRLWEIALAGIEGPTAAHPESTPEPLAPSEDAGGDRLLRGLRPIKPSGPSTPSGEAA